MSDTRSTGSPAGHPHTYTLPTRTTPKTLFFLHRIHAITGYNDNPTKTVLWRVKMGRDPTFITAEEVRLCIEKEGVHISRIDLETLHYQIYNWCDNFRTIPATNLSHLVDVGVAKGRFFSPSMFNSLLSQRQNTHLGVILYTPNYENFMVLKMMVSSREAILSFFAS